MSLPQPSRFLLIIIIILVIIIIIIIIIGISVPLFFSFFFFFLVSLLRCSNDDGIKNTRKMHIRKDRTLNRFGTGADVIIVGAGVAGSALAHTLAKVRFVIVIISHST